MTAAQFAAAYAALTASHEVADHWVQLDSQATAKGDRNRAGAIACVKHVASYTATQALALAAVNRTTGARLSWKRAALALGISAATHYVADRQGGHWRDAEPRGVARFASVTLGKHGWLQHDPHAGYLLDQAWHKGWIAVAALVAAGGGER